jgi:hypothetical protein
MPWAVLAEFGECPHLVDATNAHMILPDISLAGVKSEARR